MDVPRLNAGRNRLIKRIVIGPVLLSGIGVASFFLYRLKPAAPSVEKGSVWMDTVKRGQMLREVRGLGSLVPEEILHIPTPAEGRVERIVIDRKSTRLNSSHLVISYAVFCLKKKKNKQKNLHTNVEN